MTKRFFLKSDLIRANCADWVLRTATEGDVVSIARPTRSLVQNAKIHAIFSDVAKQKEFAGKKRTAEQWKVLMISAHSTATKSGSEIVPGLEGEFVNIRESSASMSIARLNSLLEYMLCWCAQNDVKLTEVDSVPDWVK